MHKVSALPGTLEADSFYFVANGTYAESYLTDSSGTAKLIGNSTMINELISAMSNIKIERVADITARDAVSLTATDRGLYIVTDASADATVTSGAAMYFWDGTSWTKQMEFESMDLVIDWADIQNKPTSTVAAIDQAVTDSHTHANKSVLDLITNAGSGAIITAAERIAITHTNRTALDKIGEDGDGCLTYDGVALDKWSTKTW